MDNLSPAAERNKSVIFEVLNPYIPYGARVLEIASGTGQHAAYICQKRTDIMWQPTDADPESLKIIEAVRDECGANSFREAVAFDICDDIPPAVVSPYDVIVNINMIHISPFEACLNLLNRSMRLLKKGGTLYLYGPYVQRDVETAPSNIAFDKSLRERNPTWGLRNLENVVSEAEKRGFRLVEVKAMPANNLSVVFEKVN